MAGHAPAGKKRFYENAAVAEAGGAFEVQLDGRTLRTPARRKLMLPTAALAWAIAQEWNAQGDTIEPATMPLTRLSNTACDGVAERRAEAIEEIVRYAASDAICYRAGYPAELARRQAETWDPILRWIEGEAGASFRKASGITYEEQPAQSLQKIRDAVAALNTFELAALLAMTSLTGSALIALAHARDYFAAEAAWAAAHVDEDWQASQWGMDYEAGRRREARFSEFLSASRLFRLAGRSDDRSADNHSESG